MGMGNSVVASTYIAKVKAVEGAKCTVERVLDNKEIKDVRLNVTVNVDEGLVIVPVVDSYVLITNIDGDKWFASQFGAVEKIVLNMSETITINGGGENLKSVLSDFIDEVAKIIVVQGTNPNVTALNDIKQRLSKLMN
jgi:hypothetical protein